MRDMIGNELTVGDQVHVKIGSDWVMGVIMKIQNGGLAVTGVPKDKNSPVGITPDALVLQVGVGFQSQPGHPQPGLIKISAPNQVSSLIESSVKM